MKVFTIDDYTSNFTQLFMKTMLEESVQVELVQDVTLAELILISSNEKVDDQTLPLVSNSKAPIVFPCSSYSGAEKRRLCGCLGQAMSRVVIIQFKRESVVYLMKNYSTTKKICAAK